MLQKVSYMYKVPSYIYDRLCFSCIGCENGTYSFSDKGLAYLICRRKGGTTARVAFARLRDYVAKNADMVLANSKEGA